MRLFKLTLLMYCHIQSFVTKIDTPQIMLKGHCHEKSVSEKHMGGCLEP
jgi:hypothetical protein